MIKTFPLGIFLLTFLLLPTADASFPCSDIVEKKQGGMVALEKMDVGRSIIEMQEEEPADVIDYWYKRAKKGNLMTYITSHANMNEDWIELHILNTNSCEELKVLYKTVWCCDD